LYVAIVVVIALIILARRAEQKNGDISDPDDVQE